MTINVHEYLRAQMTGLAHRAGPFLIRVDEQNASPYHNYAVPDDGCTPTDADVKELIEAFTARAHTPRLEYLPSASPAVLPALLAAGFTEEARLPLLTVDPAAVHVPEPPTGIDVRLVTADDDLRAVAEVQNEAYGQPGVADHDIARLRGSVDRGGLVALAVDTATGAGVGVGAGECLPARTGVSELVSVGVRAAYRRRGIAAAVTALLTRACPDAGIAAPFLMTLHDSETGVYQRIGYRAFGEMVHISRSPDQPSNA